MQIKKEEIENAIIAAAKAEFMDKGYKDASLRSIAKKSGVSLSNIYNYFKSKDMLFSTGYKTSPYQPQFYQRILKKTFRIGRIIFYGISYVNSRTCH